MIANRHSLNPGAYLGHCADSLVTEDATDRDFGYIATKNVQVRATDGGHVDFETGIRRIDDLRICHVLPSLRRGTFVHERLHRPSAAEAPVGLRPTSR